MILLDTHIWIWWIQDETKLSQTAIQTIQDHETKEIGVSAISCWEVAKLVEYQRLTLSCEITEWFKQALNYPGIKLLELTPEIAIKSTQLENFHKDPADQIITATAIIYDIPLITIDQKIVNYESVKTIS